MQIKEEELKDRDLRNIKYRNMKLDKYDEERR